MKYKKLMEDAKLQLYNEVIQVGSHCFLENGIEAVKMTDIALAANLGVATLYRYFGQKKDLVIKCGIYLWQKELQLFEGIFENEPFINKSGLQQVEDILKIFLVLYQGHSKFLAFVKNFDRFVEQEKIKKEELIEYDQNILNVYTLLKKSFEKGIQDGSINSKIEFDTYYFTIMHTLMSLTQKLVTSNDIVASDLIVAGAKQIELVIEMAINYIKGEN